MAFLPYILSLPIKKRKRKKDYFGVKIKIKGLGLGFSTKKLFYVFCKYIFQSSFYLIFIKLLHIVYYPTKSPKSSNPTGPKRSGTRATLDKKLRG